MEQFQFSDFLFVDVLACLSFPRNKERVVSRAAVQKFSESLKDHQKAVLPGGGTVLDEALVAHNLFCASRLYTTISFQELGSLLEISPERVRFYF